MVSVSALLLLQAKAKQEAERKAKEEADRKAKQEAEQKAREEAERKAKQEAEVSGPQVILSRDTAVFMLGWYAATLLACRKHNRRNHCRYCWHYIFWVMYCHMTKA
jgi:hypothetical protein